MTLTTDQKELLRRMGNAALRGKYVEIHTADLAALLSLIADLGGAMLKAEFYMGHSDSALASDCKCSGAHSWSNKRWAEEWKKREMEG